MVRRRRDKTDARRGLAHLGDPGVHLLAGQVAALAGLGTLSHLDLDLDSRAQIAACHAKACRSDLLDGGVLGVAVGKRRLATRVLAALAGVGTAVQAIHGNSHALVCLLANGAVAHSAGVKAAHDVVRTLHLVKRHRRAPARVKVEQVAQANGTAGPVHMSAVLPEQVVIALLAGTLQQVDGLRVDKMVLANHRTPLGKAKGGQLVGGCGL